MTKDRRRNCRLISTAFCTLAVLGGCSALPVDGEPDAAHQPAWGRFVAPFERAVDVVADTADRLDPAEAPAGRPGHALPAALAWPGGASKDPPTKGGAASEAKQSREPCPCYADGDINGDGTVSAGDAQLAFYAAIGLNPATEEQICRADCNGDGLLSAGDAQTIFEVSIGRGVCPSDLLDGRCCESDTACRSEHCQNGYCCAAGDCCGVAGHCPTGYSTPPVCDDATTCQGTRFDATCVGNICDSGGVDDDSACVEGLLSDGCGFYRSVFCTGEADQVVPACPTSCEHDDGCDPGARCEAGACVQGSEICGNDIDDDGDELVDCADPDCEGAACDDDDVCTTDDRCGSDGQCRGEAVAGASPWACVLEVCDPQTGQLSPIPDDESCADENQCTRDSCTPRSVDAGPDGCVHNTIVMNGWPCDDGDDETERDTCQAGQCRGIPIGSTEICDNGLDDDGDDDTDCYDHDCVGDDGCPCFDPDGDDPDSVDMFTGHLFDEYTRQYLFQTLAVDQFCLSSGAVAELVCLNGVGAISVWQCGAGEHCDYRYDRCWTGPAEDCANGIDDDGDGWTDCFDGEDCRFDPVACPCVDSDSGVDATTVGTFSGHVRSLTYYGHRAFEWRSAGDQGCASSTSVWELSCGDPETLGSEAVETEIPCEENEICDWRLSRCVQDVVEHCANGIDDDGDGLTDCYDFWDCSRDAVACPCQDSDGGFSPETLGSFTGSLWRNFPNHGWVVGMADQGCRSATELYEIICSGNVGETHGFECPTGHLCDADARMCIQVSEPEICDNGIDDDWDGLDDCFDIDDCLGSDACPCSDTDGGFHPETRGFFGGHLFDESIEAWQWLDWMGDTYLHYDQGCLDEWTVLELVCEGNEGYALHHDCEPGEYCSAGEGRCVRHERDCTNGRDDDLDGATDCQDEDCDLRACSDGNPCTKGDTCREMQCVGDATAANGDACDDGNPFTWPDWCQNGQCRGITARVCCTAGGHVWYQMGGCERPGVVDPTLTDPSACDIVCCPSPTPPWYTTWYWDCGPSLWNNPPPEDTPYLYAGCATVCCRSDGELVTTQRARCIWAPGEASRELLYDGACRPELCANGIDDDDDGLTDCDDYNDCPGDPACLCSDSDGGIRPDIRGIARGYTPIADWIESRPETCTPDQGGVVEFWCDNDLLHEQIIPCDSGMHCEEGACVPNDENCTNGIDDDEDGLTDCQDVDTCAGEACEDGNLCTLDDVCTVAGDCVGTPRSVSDGWACTIDACNPATGQVTHTVNHLLCEDGNPCTLDRCMPGDAQADPDGCYHNASIMHGEPCDDGDACTQDDTCQFGLCLGVVPIELCDGIDNDCDGQTDEDLQRPCSTACGPGVESCAAGQWGPCSAPQPTPELCDGIDNDCDGRTDEDLGTVTCGVGACQRTVAACVHGAPQICEPGLPGYEVCDRVDNDCNGIVDDLGTLTCGVGACQRTVEACVHGASQICEPGLPGYEVCDGIDNDCDGTTDEGCEPIMTGACCTLSPRTGLWACADDVTEADCLDTWQGAGTTCATHPCGVATVQGACCGVQGCSMVRSALLCEGEFLGLGTECVPDPCPGPVPIFGACCIGPSCVLTDAVDCMAQDGVYIGGDCTAELCSF